MALVPSALFSSIGTCFRTLTDHGRLTQLKGFLRLAFRMFGMSSGDHSVCVCVCEFFEALLTNKESNEYASSTSVIETSPTVVGV